MIDRQHIPFFVFIACLALALALAYFTNEWPTALAISLAGCAIGLAMRQPEQEDHDTAFLEEEMQEIRAASERRELDVAAIRTSVDELAGIVESLAADQSRIAQSSGAAESERLRAVVEALGKRVAALDAPRKQADTRLDTLEQSVASLRADRAQVAGVTDLRTVEPVAVNGGPVVSAPVSAKPTSIMDAAVAMGGRPGRLRDRLARVKKTRQVRGAPVFGAGGEPASLLIDDPAEKSDAEGAVAVLRHALSLIASDDGGSRIFVRLDEAAIADPDLAAALSPVVAEGAAALPRLTVIVPQSALRGGTPAALTALTGAGAAMGLERMTDWSVDLAALAASGLDTISVDGPAMARSAKAQKGDPTRLKSVLAARGIALIAANVASRDQLDAVGTLVPDYLTGPGLGDATPMEATA